MGYFASLKKMEDGWGVMDGYETHPSQIAWERVQTIAAQSLVDPVLTAMLMSASGFRPDGTYFSHPEGVPEGWVLPPDDTDKDDDELSGYANFYLQDEL